MVTYTVIQFYNSLLVRWIISEMDPTMQYNPLIYESWNGNDEVVYILDLPVSKNGD